ncbi:hypothetical protein IHQ68_17415 [Chelatococcus sambhunathii]|uniref:Uncharacterized protein n=1 Tax=Chelatococcus sambhunathii TaxID=363953 RepID=A0ABU1DJV9_9HYPH|nr:hypothetical protein [Chelatococcus sambhunathii]MDR4308401.1 hypothetical protein [Chelatococcus sambhunathii]
MTAIAYPLAPEAVVSPLAELRRRHPALASAGFAFVMLAAISASLSLVDGRLIDGVSVWAKPAKFFLSSGVLMLSSAWFFGYVRPERRNARPLRLSANLLIGFGVFELAYITFQAAQGARSHFNVADVPHYALYAMMGLAALGMLATKLVLAREIASRPAENLSPELRVAVVLGLVLTAILGSLSGLSLSANQSHNVGAVGGAAPIFGWNRLGGDLRVAHFFGMHAEQAIPLATAAAAAVFGAAWGRRVALALAVLIVAATLAVFVQALLGRPFAV